MENDVSQVPEETESVVNHQNNLYLGIPKIIWKQSKEVNFVYLGKEI